MSWNPTIKTMTIATFATALAGLPATAQDFAQTGVYVGAGVAGGVYTQAEDDLEDELRSLGYVVDVDIDTAAGFNVFGGYRAHAHAAVEMEFEMLPKADIDVSGVELAELLTLAVTANAKAYPFKGRVQPFALVGIGVLYARVEDSVGLGADTSDSGFAARFGGGVDVYITELIALWARSTYVLPAGDVDGLDYVSFGGGVMFRF